MSAFPEYKIVELEKEKTSTMLI